MLLLHINKFVYKKISEKKKKSAIVLFRYIHSFFLFYRVKKKTFRCHNIIRLLFIITKNHSIKTEILTYLWNIYYRESELHTYIHHLLHTHRSKDFLITHFKMSFARLSLLSSELMILSCIMIVRWTSFDVSFSNKMWKILKKFLLSEISIL